MLLLSGPNIQIELTVFWLSPACGKDIQMAKQMTDITRLIAATTNHHMSFSQCSHLSGCGANDVILSVMKKDVLLTVFILSH